MRLFTKSLAFVMLAVAPSMALAAGTDTTVKTGGLSSNDQYLNSTTKVTMTVDQACSSLSTTDVDLGTTNDSPSHPNGQAYSNTFSVTTQCTNPHGAFLSFQSPNFDSTGNDCLLTGGPGGATIPYKVTYTGGGSSDSRSTGTNYCGALGSDTNTAYRFDLGDTETNPSFVFTATATPAATTPAGSYADTMQVYLEF